MNKLQEALNNLIPSMVRQAHHERNRQAAVRPEPVEGSKQRVLKRLLLLMACLAFAPPAWAGKAVALVYDDSGSMNSHQSWVAANYSVQVLTAMTGEDDRLFVVKMSDAGPEPAKSFAGIQGIESLLQWFRQQAKPDRNTGTPYQSVRKAIDALVSSAAEEKWLLVLTDGGFEGENEAEARADIDLAFRQHHVHTAFLLIQQQKHELADLWEREGHAMRFDADSSAKIPAQMEAFADLLNARSSVAKGVTAKVEGSEWVVSSKFPLRHLIVLRQDSKPAKLLEARSPTEALHVRQHDVVAREKNKGLPEAHIAHIAGTRVIKAGDDMIRLRFDQPADLARVKLLPEVAAKFVVKLREPAGTELQPDPQGIHSFCQGDAITVETRLLDDEGKAITAGRADIGTFTVGVTLDGQFKPETVNLPGQEFFSATLTPEREIELVGSAIYPGYFHFQSEPIRLRPRVCTRDIRLTVTGLDADGQWRAEVDRVRQAPFVEIGATIDGKPASAEAMAGWALGHDGADLLEWRQQGATFRVRPKSACCAWLWARASAGESQVKLNLDTHNPRDQVRLPAPLRFAIVQPGDSLRTLWWYACPAVWLLSTLLLLWWLWRLWVKQRFAKKASLWTQDGTTKVFHALRLRKHASWLLRWFWPSAREKASIDGMGILAQGKGAAILVIGNSLDARHEIDGWMFDENLTATGKPQRDARVIDRAEIVVLDPARRQRGAFARRYKYCRDGTDPGWV